MPFLQILWDPELIGADQIVRVRDALLAAVGPALMAVDPVHVVNAAMVEVRVVAIGPLDQVRSPVFVTLFARTEPGRRAGAAAVVRHLVEAVSPTAPEVEPTIELVLTDHHSSFDYTSLE
jgi:hypothetical protein